jgi:hypothetical protein
MDILFLGPGDRKRDCDTGPVRNYGATLDSMPVNSELAVDTLPDTTLLKSRKGATNKTWAISLSIGILHSPGNGIRSGILTESGISLRIILVAAPVRRKYQSVGKPSRVTKFFPTGVWFATL